MKPQESANNKGKKTRTWEGGKHSKRANYLRKSCVKKFSQCIVYKQTSLL